MAFTAFLTFDSPDLKGESQDPNHANAIELQAFHFEVDTLNVPLTGGRAPNFGLLKIMKAVDRTSPMLMFLTSKGTHVKQATLALHKSGNAKADYMIYKMTEVGIASHEVSGSAGDDTPSETIQLTFAELEIRHTMISATGATGTITSTAFNFSENNIK